MICELCNKPMTSKCNNAECGNPRTWDDALAEANILIHILWDIVRRLPEHKTTEKRASRWIKENHNDMR